MIKTINHVYLDMDGVITDLDLDMINKWKKDDKFQENFTKFIKKKGFSKLGLKEDAKLLLDFLIASRVRVTILSSAGNPEKGLFDKVQDQKNNWLKEHNINFPSIIVVKKDDKKNYAKENALLIDDTESNCKEFEDKGGNSIKHLSALHTINLINRVYFLKAS